jgi:hypothetical protein
MVKSRALNYRPMEMSDYTRSLLDRFKRPSAAERTSGMPRRAVRNARRQIQRRRRALERASVKSYRPIEPTPYLSEILARFKSDADRNLVQSCTKD